MPALPNLLASKRGRRSAFFLLYVTEGIPLGFAAVAMVAQMRLAGVGPAAIGWFVAWFYLPWSWKWAAGPVVDLVYSERLGRRRAWIVACQLMMSITLLMAWPIDFTTRLSLLVAVLAVHNVFSAIQDVAIDALAVDTLPKEERGMVNGLMFAGAYLGQMIGGAGVLFLASYIDFNMTFPIVVGVLLAVTFGVSIWLRETPRDTPIPGENQLRIPTAKRVVGEIGNYLTTALKAVFGSRRSIAGLVFALLPAGAYGLSLALASNLAVEFGMSERKIALFNGVTAIVAALGCVAGGWLSDRLGRRKAVAGYVLLTLLPTLAVALAMWREGWIMPVDTTAADRPTAGQSLLVTFWIAAGAYSLFQGLIYGARGALFMDLCHPIVAATQFTAYMALMNLVIAYSSWWQGWSAERWGYPATLLLDACLGLLCLAALPLMRPVAGKETAPLGAVPLVTPKPADTGNIVPAR